MRKFLILLAMTAMIAAAAAGCGTEPYDNDIPYWDAPDVHTVRV